MLTPDQVRLRLDEVKDAYTRGSIAASLFLLTRLFEDTAPEFAAFVQQVPRANPWTCDICTKSAVHLHEAPSPVADDDDA